MAFTCLPCSPCLCIRRPPPSGRDRRFCLAAMPFLVGRKVVMLGRRCRSSAGEAVKSQRNSKRLLKSPGAGRPRVASAATPTDAGPASRSGRGEAVATVYEIGPFRLDPRAGVLTRLGITEALGPRAAAVLTVLVQNANQPVSKDVLMDAAWP